MAIKVVRYTDDRVPAVTAFNRRMSDGQSDWGWYASAEDT